MAVESPPGRGSTFHFTLPTAPAAMDGGSPSPQPVVKGAMLFESDSDSIPP